MFRNTVVNASLANRVARSFSKRQYHMFSKRQLPTQNAHILQVGQTPGTNLFAMFGVTIKNPGWERSKLYDRKYLVKNYGAIPIILILGASIIGASSYAIYAAMTRDVKYRKNGKYQICETVDLRNPRCYKLMNKNPDHYRPRPELADLLDDMAEAQKTAEKCKGGK